MNFDFDFNFGGDIHIGLYSCLVFLFPIYLVELMLWQKLPFAGFHDRSRVSKGLIQATQVMRWVVLGISFILGFHTYYLSPLGWVLVTLGFLAFIGAWLAMMVAKDSAWSRSKWGVLAIYAVPFITFTGAAIIGRSFSFFLLATVYSVLRVIQGMNQFNFIQKPPPQP